ncbi:hypothetical protein ACOKS3_09465 [Pseudomonas sp. HS6-2]|uniref:hypothetical protein n=1 Tax=Pseudomonas sp. HS6-2 TaxID=3410986 RepID=UPI003BC42794
MPTENRSSNTKMAVKLQPCPYCGQQDAFVEQLDSDASVVICQGRTGKHSACLARGPVGVQQHECEDQPGHDQAVQEWNNRAAPQPHAEPIAWIVDTAIWWTKEEAERDATSTGKPMIPFGPMTTVCSPAKQPERSGLFSDEDRYLLCREELRECEDERSALSDEARGLRDRAAKLDALLAEALLAIEGGCHAVSLPARIKAELCCDDEQDPPSGYFFDTGPYQVELGEEQWLKALSVFDNYTQGNQDTFACPSDNLRGLVSEILIELSLAPAVD